MEEVVQIYGDGYFSNPAFRETDHTAYFGYMDYLEDRENIQRRLRQILARVEREIPPGRCLDIGCGPGLFVEVAGERGWEGSGIDPNEDAVKWAKENVSDQVRLGTAETLEWPDEYFDCVTMFDVIEHMADPRVEMADVWRVLRPGGLLVVATPDAGALITRVLGAHWLEMKRVPEHLQFFSVESLARMLSVSGFTPFEWHSMGKITSWRIILADLRFYSKPVFAAIESLLDRLHLADTVVDADPRSKFCLYARKSGPPSSLETAVSLGAVTVHRATKTGMGRIGIHRFRPTDISEPPVSVDDGVRPLLKANPEERG
jgi:2-polyprenyl-3-methyl-5-hydroxy-6-metoxy-1,4-benzoquinol methylase